MLPLQTKAPDFTLQDKDGKEVSLSDFRGRRVVLYFYSKDGTSGCTTQAQTYRDLYPQIEQENAVVIGISKNTPKQHANFAQKHELPFILLADPYLAVENLYDVIKEKNMYGKKVMGTVRTTFLIDEEGIIVRAYEKVKPAVDASILLDDLKAMDE